MKAASQHDKARARSALTQAAGTPVQSATSAAFEAVVVGQVETQSAATGNAVVRVPARYMKLVFHL